MSLPSTAANKPVVLGKVGICLLNIVSYFAVLALYQSSLGPRFVVGKRVKARRAKQTEWWIGRGKGQWNLHQITTQRALSDFSL